ncbi:uncharacterized protein LOC122945818 [Bufo gargarizans]|uniref:uncharacterized protein LOC122945818 n=1 Tax=Bufo gargarizans TaxID=30331 RepID=UPI001CF4C3D3|nr:uncharacterized protein LOC122945818 [Bufo gargarizans]
MPPLRDISEDGWRCEHCNFCNTEWGRLCRRCETPRRDEVEICYRNLGSLNPPVSVNQVIGSPQCMSTPVAPPLPSAQKRLITRFTREGTGNIWQIIQADEVKRSPMTLRSVAWICKCKTAHSHNVMECPACRSLNPKCPIVIPDMGMYPVMTQNTHTCDAAGNPDRLTQQVEWYKPWSQGEQLVMIEKLSDPYKDPTGFYKGIQRIQQTYDAVWTDLSALIGAAAGLPLIEKIKKVEGAGIEPIPVGADAKLKKSGEMFLKRLEVVMKELNSKLGTGLPEAHQASDETTDKYYARITGIFKDQDFDIRDPDSRDA